MSRLSSIIESILFVSGNAVEISAIAEKLNASQTEIEDAIKELKLRFNADTGINVMNFNKKLQFCSNPEYAKQVESVLNPIKEKELTSAMLETLAIIAYKQPITRLEVEEVRGVDCTYSVQNLTRLGMIEAVGRKDTIGKPILFATTDDFLKRFSLSDIHDLPDYESLLERLQAISDDRSNLNIVEKPMFDSSADEPLPEFLKDEKVAVIE
ncbi:MAG: SMC-Scp complex subunit ScpB [Corallococcus sp.]|nr:SMC-Scp complex subunit ScpB [Corallococcus sp.]